MYNFTMRMTRFISSRATQERILGYILAHKLQHKKRFQSSSTKVWGQVWHYTDVTAFLSTYRQIFIEKIYQYNTTVVKDYPLILDCGANIGLSCFYFTHNSPNARIIAFEPDPKIFQVLKKNLYNNSMEQNVLPLNVALWSEPGQKISFSTDDSDGGHVTPGQAQGITVDTVRLKDYLHEPVGLLKLDIEGAEYEVLADTTDYLKNVQQVIIEVHSVVGQPQRHSELLNILEKTGFRIQINNIHRWMNPLVQSPIMGRFDQLLIVYGYRSHTFR